MNNLNTYIIEKLRINSKTKVEKYEVVDAKNLDELKYWVHNEWDGESSFLIHKSISMNDLDDLCDYMVELDDNAGESGRADYWADDYNDKYNILNVDLDG